MNLVNGVSVINTDNQPGRSGNIKVLRRSDVYVYALPNQ